MMSNINELSLPEMSGLLAMVIHKSGGEIRIDFDDHNNFLEWELSGKFRSWQITRQENQDGSFSVGLAESQDCPALFVG